MLKRLFCIFICLWPALGQAAGQAVTVIDDLSGKNSYSMSLQILALMTLLTVLPSILLTMTSFTRIIIVLGMLRQAIGMPQTPNNQILVGLSLFLTFFIMTPVYNEINKVSIEPFILNKIDLKQAVLNSVKPIKAFMVEQTRENDLTVFKDIVNDQTPIEKYKDLSEEVPFSILLPSFVTSELKTAFQIGFMLFIPFLVIDLVVASVLMAMGMMMLSPLIISLPFKIMLFILIDGWALIMSTLASSFGG
jgi:flagellar biosynthetic protein FliP